MTGKCEHSKQPTRAELQAARDWLPTKLPELKVKTQHEKGVIRMKDTPRIKTKIAKCKQEISEGYLPIVWLHKHDLIIGGLKKVAAEQVTDDEFDQIAELMNDQLSGGDVYFETLAEAAKQVLGEERYDNLVADEDEEDDD